MTENPKTGVPLPQLARQTANKLTALLADTDPEAAAWVEGVRATRPETPTVVVVGETNRGKSSLVNALLAVPGLSPVDASVATASYLVFRHAPEWSAHACYPGADDPVPVRVDALAGWVSAAHELPDGRPPPRYLDVAGPVPLLTRISLVDTPGVGGLDEAHGQLAAEAAEAATALLFVLDASAPITKGELEFLARLGERVETVLFALTKIDLHRGWREIASANREMLGEHAPRFADAAVYPVSARLFETAATSPTAEVATMLRERSGIAELQTALQQQVTGRALMLGEANTLRALSTALGGVIARLRSEERALSSGEDEAEQLRSRRDELASARRSSTRGWQLRLRGEIQRARVESTHEVGGLIRSAQTRIRSGIDSADRAALARLQYHVDATLQAISGQVSTALAARVGNVADAALAELFTADELAVIRASVARRGQPPVVMRPPEPRPGSSEDKLLLAMGFSGGLGVGRLAVLPLAGLGVAAGAIVLPASIALGLGAGWWMSRTRRHAADKQHLKQWLSDVFTDARAVLDQLVAEQLIDAEQQLSLALDDALGRRLNAIEDELRDVDRSLKLDAADRNRQLTQVADRLAEARAGQQAVDGLLLRIRRLRDR